MVNACPYQSIRSQFLTEVPYVNGVFTGCDRSKTQYVYRLRLPFTEPIIAYHNCIVNEAVSLFNRHLVLTPKTDVLKALVSRCYERLRRRFPPKQLTPINIHQVIMSKPPSKRRTYRNAHMKYIQRGVVRRDKKITMFVKYERMNIRDPLKPPRAIQARGQVFNLVLQRYIIPYSKHITRSFDPTRRFATKGMNNYVLGRFLRTCWDDFSSPRARMFDHDRFDSRTNTPWLDGMHSYMADHYSNDTELPSLLETLNSASCRSQHGLVYSASDCVFSGDVTTSDGNSTVNCALLTDYTWGVRSHTPLNGDDSVVFHDTIDDAVLDSRNIGEYGYKTKGSSTLVFEEIEYCQCHPVHTINGWLMVRDPHRVLSRTTTCLQSFASSHEYLMSWFASVGECEYSCNHGVPILQSFAKFLMRASPKRVKVYHEDFRRIRGSYSDEITEDCRLSFTQAFGITSIDQRWLEEYFDKLCWGFDSIIVDYPSPQLTTIPKIY